LELQDGCSSLSHIRHSNSVWVTSAAGGRNFDYLGGIGGAVRFYDAIFNPDRVEAEVDI
jgi:hypothetical protein